jgi:hypothetical protein
MKDIQIRINLKDKETGKLTSTYPPIAAEANGLNRWPIDDNWEILSVDRGSGIMIEDIVGREWEAYEGDNISIMGSVPKDYDIIFKDGMFGIEVGKEYWIHDFVHTLELSVFINKETRDYHRQQLDLQKIIDKDEYFFIPLSHLNIGGTIEGIATILINHKNK